MTLPPLPSPNMVWRIGMGRHNKEIEMRNFLVTKMCCSVCGNMLELTYKKPEKTSPGHCVGEPTGAYMVEQAVYLEPCRTCMRPLEDMRRLALSVMGLK